MGRPETEPGRLCRTGGEDAELIAACRAGGHSRVRADRRALPARGGRGRVCGRTRSRARRGHRAGCVCHGCWTKLAGLRDVERLPAWLCGIARNIARARRRTLRREERSGGRVAGDSDAVRRARRAPRSEAALVAGARARARGVPRAARAVLLRAAVGTRGRADAWRERCGGAPAAVARACTARRRCEARRARTVALASRPRSRRARGDRARTSGPLVSMHHREEEDPC